MAALRPSGCDVAEGSSMRRFTICYDAGGYSSAGAMSARGASWTAWASNLLGLPSGRRQWRSSDGFSVTTMTSSYSCFDRLGAQLPSFSAFMDGVGNSLGLASGRRPSSSCDCYALVVTSEHLCGSLRIYLFERCGAQTLSNRLSHHRCPASRPFSGLPLVFRTH